MDRISIKGLEVFANHGVLREENVLGQKFIIHADMYLDTREAGLDDNLAKTLNYGEISKEISEYFSKYTYNLLEAAAEHLAAFLLTKYKLMQRIDLEIEKPWAPVGLPLNTVSVAITRQRHTAFISFGSNVGDREAHIRAGIDALNRAGGCQVKRVSEMIETKAYGYIYQEDFLNGCLELETLLTPEELLLVLNKIEAEEGRERVIRWGPRTLDLDIIFYDRQVYDSKNLVIPHIDMQNRQFVLQPLSELIPDFRHPLLGKTVRELLNALEE